MVQQQQQPMSMPPLDYGAPMMPMMAATPLSMNVGYCLDFSGSLSLSFFQVNKMGNLFCVEWYGEEMNGDKTSTNIARSTIRSDLFSVT